MPKKEPPSLLSDRPDYAQSLNPLPSVPAYDKDRDNPLPSGPLPIAPSEAMTERELWHQRTLAQPPEDATSLFERLARDPAVDVEKLKELLAMHERMAGARAKADFDAAFSIMQGEIPVIDEKGQILVQGELRSTYARNEDIQRIVKPILQKYGFALRFRNETLENGRLKIVGILGHRGGHAEQDEFITAADKTGSKNDIQAIGSARAYGQRYCTIALLNIATALEDDDGERAGKSELPEEPSGFREWLMDAGKAADKGTPALEAFWLDAPEKLKKYLVNTDRQRWEKLKKKAADVVQKATTK